VKAFSLLLLFVAAFVASGCRSVYVERRRTVYVDRPGYYYRRPAPVVVAHRPYYRHRHVTKVVYYNDRHGRYYWRDGRRIYVRHY
jgi:hypothetical protein